MTCDIFIRSYWKDFAWLELCLASIHRFCQGFRSAIVVVPRSSAPWLRQFPALRGEHRLEFCRDYRDDYLGQQATKLAADTLTDADFICHVDADCIFARPTTPEDLIVDGRPRVVMRSYDRLDRHWPWRRPTEAFLGWSITHDFMQRAPFTFPRWIYGELRAHSLAVHGVDLERYVTTRRPRGFSEFNALGAFARARHPERFVWLDDAAVAPGPAACRWYWSWERLDPRTRADIEALLRREGDHNGSAA